MKIWDPKPPGTLWATPGLLRDCFTFTFGTGKFHAGYFDDRFQAESGWNCSSILTLLGSDHQKPA